MTTGQVVELSVNSGLPMPSGVNGLKVVVLADLAAYGNSPDLLVQIVDKCPPGGGTVLLDTAFRHAGRWSVHFVGSLTGRCLYKRITATSVSGNPPIWVGDYYFSGPSGFHFAD